MWEKEEIEDIQKIINRDQPRYNTVGAIWWVSRKWGQKCGNFDIQLVDGRAGSVASVKNV